MGLGFVTNVDADRDLREAVRLAFDRIRASARRSAALVFETRWQPTMDLVDIAEDCLVDSDYLEQLTLVHPSAAMSFIASMIGSRVETVSISAQRSIYDEPEVEDTDATASKTMFTMARGEPIEAFVSRSVATARQRVLRRFALLFEKSSQPDISLAALLAEELLHSGVKEIGLIHPSASLDAMVAALRLRLPGVSVAYASKPASPPTKA
jgi:hypothetical protein